MASGAAPPFPVKAGYWLCGSKYFIRSVEEIPSQHFTHLYAGFAEVNGDDGAVTVPEQHSDQFGTFTETVRKQSSTVKTLLSIGGEGAQISPVVRNAQKRRTFIKTSIDLARNFHFDGLDLCWLYPSPTDNADNLESLLNDWRIAVIDDAKKRHMPELLLTAAVSHHPVILGRDQRSFNYPDISKSLDLINVLAVDFYTPSDSNSPNETGPVHAWCTRSIEPDRCGSDGIRSWIAIIPSQKVVLSLPFYGYKWILDDSNKEQFFAPAHPATNRNPISYRDIRRNNPNDNTFYLASYCLQDERGSLTWFGFDDVSDISKKVSLAIGETYKLRGYFAWNVGGDDDKWALSRAASSAADAVKP